MKRRSTEETKTKVDWSIVIIVALAVIMWGLPLVRRLFDA